MLDGDGLIIGQPQTLNGDDLRVFFQRKTFDRLPVAYLHAHGKHAA